MCKSPVEGKNERGKCRILSGKSLMAVLMVAVMAVSCFVLINDSDDSSAAKATEVRICNPGGDDNIIFDKTMDDPYGGEDWSAHFDSDSGTFTLNDSNPIDPNSPSYFYYDEINYISGHRRTL